MSCLFDERQKCRDGVEFITFESLNVDNLLLIILTRVKNVIVDTHKSDGLKNLYPLYVILTN